MSESPIEELIRAVDGLDLEATMALFAPDAHFLSVDGRRAAGADAVRRLIGDFFAMLRSSSHRITAQWHPEEDVWIAEALGTYELKDWLLIKDVPRALVVTGNPAGIAELHAYGAHEHRLDEHRTAEAGMMIGGRLIPPL